MCGRYTLTTTGQDLRALFGCGGLEAGLEPRYNIAPTQPVVVVDNGERRELRTMRWGLVPRWAKDPSIGNRMINARAETLAEKPSFREPFRRRRCLIVADGFYEWRKTGGEKVPIYVFPKDGGPITFAGLWDSWTSPDGEVIESCAIVTCAANELVGEFHDRMPVILPPEARDAWLEPGPVDPERLKDLLVPCPADRLDTRVVSKEVNHPARDGPHLIEPAG